MKVFKFGGASVNSVERINNLPNILNEYKHENLVVIISAMGKTTNALEKVVDAFFAGHTDESISLFNIVKQQHITTAKYVLVTHYNQCIEQLNDFFVEVEWLLHDKPVREYDYYYDQIVSTGELLSTCIISHYLNEMNVNNEWLDVRDIIRTDNNFRDATIDWEITANRIKDGKLGMTTSKNSESPFPSPTIFITQGFIGATDENENTTLGREGSDYSAAVFANILNAESLTIWKDVEGVMNADPKTFHDAQLMHQLSYEEVIEMAFYGAQVIHPKTIKPLQNKSIPLHVKCFLDASLQGTTIINKVVKNLPPIKVIKDNQVLITLATKDFSFVGQEPMAQLYAMMNVLKIKPTLIQSGAITVQICMDDKPEKIEQLALNASGIFDIQVQKELSILTIRHYTKKLVTEMLEGKEILLQQQTKETIQVVFK